MSTKTTFKRIALVAVAALGLGVLSVAPSQAALSGDLTFTVTNGTSAPTVSDTTTAAVISVEGLLTQAYVDTIAVRFIAKGAAPTAATNFTSPRVMMGVLDTATANSSSTTKITGQLPKATTGAAGTGDSFTGTFRVGNMTESATAGGSSFGVYTTSTGYAGARFWVQLDTATAPMYGTYNYTALVTTYSTDVAGTVTTKEVAKDFSITVAKPAAISTTVDPSQTTVVMNAGSPTTFSAVDSAVAAVATASNTTVATIRTNLYNASAGTTAQESITATLTGAGIICNSAGTVCGNNLTIAGVGTSNDFLVRANGTAGVGTIVVKTTSVTFPAKTVNFYAKAAKTITVATNQPVIAVAAASSSDVVRATITDADGNVWGGTAYIYAASAADALIAGSETPVACTYNSTYGFHSCPVSGTAAGTANFKVIDASTVALATATSASSAAVRVSTGVATTAKITFDKATYAPGEKATVLVTVLDAAGLALPAKAITSLWAAAPTSSVAFSTGGDTLGADVTLAGATSATSKTTAGSQQYTIYMPYASGDVTISATGGTGLALAGRVAVTATASVVNSSVDAATDAANEATDAANAATDAALAAADAADAATAAAQDASDAVAALSATVAKLVASLKAQITSLTNLVIKIQKKVKA